MKSRELYRRDVGRFVADEVPGSGYVVVVMENGDKAYVRTQGTTTMKDGKPVSGQGTWSYTGGTGKLKGITGKGTYTGTPNADGTWNDQVDGDYAVPAAKAKK